MIDYLSKVPVKKHVYKIDDYRTCDYVLVVCAGSRRGGRSLGLNHKDSKFPSMFRYQKGLVVTVIGAMCTPSII